jgi:DNA-binding response OmpR family regulator
MGVRILIVEDEDLIGDSLVLGLREEGFSVERAKDGAQAWAALQTQTWDLVVLDWRLPVQDGLTVLKRFRERDRRTPVLFLTARDAVDDRVDGLDAGADDYLCKPYAFAELLARVRALLRRGEERASSILEFDELKLDLKTQRTQRAGHVLDLTAKEYGLLLFLMRHPNQVLSRTRIYEGVWDERYDGVSNTLEVHVMELRRKLEVHGERIIHTIRGRGYLFGRLPSDDDREGDGA